MWVVPDDVAKRWRPLSSAEIDRASVLIEDAEDIVRGQFTDIEQRLDASVLPLSTVKRVVANMVKRAMINMGSDGVASQSQGAGPFSLQQTFANPTGNLYLTAEERATLSGDSADGRSRMGWLL